MFKKCYLITQNFHTFFNIFYQLKLFEREPSNHFVELNDLILNICILLGLDITFNLIIGKNWKKFGTKK